MLFLVRYLWKRANVKQYDLDKTVINHADFDMEFGENFPKSNASVRNITGGICFTDFAFSVRRTNLNFKPKIIVNITTIEIYYLRSKFGGIPARFRIFMNKFKKGCWCCR